MRAARRTLVPLLATVALGLVACTHTPSSSPRAADPEPVESLAHPGGVHCGYERWAVKTGTDPLARQVDLRPVGATVGALGATPSPLPPVTTRYPPQIGRQSAEERTYTVAATIVGYAVEQDGDLHLALADGAARMIAEIPNPVCVGAGSPFAAGIASARRSFLARTHYRPPVVPAGQYTPTFVSAHLPATVTGVAFYDWPHGQYGVAPNAVELHPVLVVTFP